MRRMTQNAYFLVKIARKLIFTTLGKKLVFCDFLILIGFVYNRLCAAP